MNYKYLLIFLLLIFTTASCTHDVTKIVSNVNTGASCSMEKSLVKFNENKNFILFANPHVIVSFTRLNEQKYSKSIDSLIKEKGLTLTGTNYNEFAKLAGLPSVEFNIEKLIASGKCCVFSKKENRFVNKSIQINEETSNVDKEIRINFEALIEGESLYSSYSISNR